jgi:hypothetical protein
MKFFCSTLLFSVSFRETESGLTAFIRSHKTLNVLFTPVVAVQFLTVVVILFYCNSRPFVTVFTVLR